MPKFFSMFSKFIKDPGAAVRSAIGRLTGRKPSTEGSQTPATPSTPTPPRPKNLPGKTPAVTPSIDATAPAVSTADSFRNMEKDAMTAARRMIRNYREGNASPAEKRAYNKAIEYLNRRARLEKGGPFQDRNRMELARSYLGSGYTSAADLEKRVQKSLDTFNTNFGFNFTQETYENMGRLMDTPEFQKLKELYSTKYDALITMIGDAVESGKDPRKIYQALQIYETGKIPPDYQEFVQLVNLPDEELSEVADQVEEFSESRVFATADDVERLEKIQGIFGNYISYKGW